MSGKKDSGFLSWLTDIRGAITATVTFISLIVAFVVSMQSNASLAIIISTAVGVGVLLLACLYFALLWKPERNDKSAAIIVPSAKTDTAVAVYNRRVKQRKAIRRTAIGGLVLIPLLFIGGFLTLQRIANMPPKDFLILVTSFEEDNPTNPLSLMVFNQLEDIVEDYEDVKVRHESRHFITEEQEARSFGKDRKASLVIWGSYQSVATDASLSSANFTLVQPPPSEELTIDYSDVSGGSLPLPIQNLKEFPVPILEQVTAETNYLTLFTLGLMEYFDDKPEQSLTSFEKALETIQGLKEKPPLYPLYYYTGNSYLYLSDYQQAVDSYNQVVETSPSTTGVLLNRAVALARLEGREQEALEDIDIFTESYPDNTTGYVNKGLIYFLVEDYAGSIAAFDKVLATEPNNEVALVGKGRALRIAGSEAESIPLFDKALEINSQNVEAIRNKAQALKSQGSYAEALSLFEQLIENEQDSAFAYSKKGDILYEQEGDVNGAIRAYNAALEIDPELFIAALAKARIFYTEDLYEEAITASDVALTIKPANPRSYYDLHVIRGTAFNQLGRYSEALSAFDKAVKFDSSDSNILLGQGAASEGLGKYEKAAEFYERAASSIEEGIKRTALYKQTVFCYAKAGQTEKALSSLESYVNSTQDIDRDFFNNNAAFDSLRGDTRFAATLG